MNRQDQMQAVADSYVQGKKFAGIQWQVQVAGETVNTGSAGFADAETQKPIPDKALYRIFSMTKPVVSVLALKLIEQGKLRLYDLLPQLDPRFAKLRVLTPQGQIQPLQRPVTVEDLLTHRGGFSYEFIPGCHVSAYYREAEILADGQRSLSDMMGALAELPLAFQPGSSWRYSVCTDVVAHVCECVTGRSLADLLQEYIFAPLGMKDTGFTVPEGQQERLMSMYGVGDLLSLPSLDITPQELVPINVEQMCPLNNPQFQRGGLGLYSTLEDYVLFANMLLDGKAQTGEVILSRKMMQMLRANRIPPEQMPLAIGPNVLAGYGWGLVGRVMIDPGQAKSLSDGGEFGWAGAASTYFWVDPGEQMTGVVMAQYMGATLPLTDDMRVAAYQALI